MNEPAPYIWRRLGRIFNPLEITDRPWLKRFAQAPATLVFDDIVRVYFSCRPAPDAQGQYVSYSAYVDLDRRDLTVIRAIAREPVLTLGGMGTFDEFGTYPLSVIRHNDEIRAYFGGWTRCESVPFNVAIGAASSTDDGKTFTRLGAGPVIGYSPDEPFVMSGPKIRRFNGLWHLYYIAGKKWIMHDGRAEPVYTIRMALSEDGINWEKQNRELLPVRLEENECQASPDVTFANGCYHMFFCYRYSTDYRGHEKGYRIGYASSPDGLNWQRDDARAGLDVAADGWDAEMVSYPHILQLDGKTYMFYLGNGVGREGFGLAELQGAL